MDKIVFLDIDGPVIPGRVHDGALCSDFRSRFAKDSIECLNILCEQTYSCAKVMGGSPTRMRRISSPLIIFK